MIITRFVAILLIGVLLIIGACASPAMTTPPATTPPATTPPPTTPPAPTTPTPAPTTPTPAPTTPTPAPTTPTPALTTPTPAPATGPAAFIVSDLKTDPPELHPGDNVRVIVTVTNTGGQTGTYTVVLKVQDDLTGTENVKTQDVTLAGGASQRVTLTILVGPIGSYTVIIDKLTGKFLVYAAL